MADPELNLGVFSRPEGPSGEGTSGVCPPVGGGTGDLPEKILKKNGAKWCNLECK